MTEFFSEDGKVHPATVLKATPLTVTALKTVDRDGYEAIQIGFGAKSLKRITKPMAGHLKELGNFSFIQELRGVSAPAVGEMIESEFEVGDKVAVSSISKGKGFQGVVKRHGFHGGPRSHGQKHSEREPGSIGAGGYQRVFKGRKMAGRMGGDRVTVKNLVVVAFDKENNQLFVRGAVPGRRGTLVEVQG